jgi:hypothetical protein
MIFFFLKKKEIRLVVNIFILREENERKEAIAFIGLRDENGTQLGPATESHKHSGKDCT